MNLESKKWLANILEAKDADLSLYLTNEDVSGFLIIWTLFEQKHFDGFVRYNKLETYAKNNSEIIRDNGNLKEIFNYFFSRYKNSEPFSNLIHEYTYKEIENLLKEDDVSDEKKLFFLIFVVYRYRNNIFHGVKGVQSWTKFEEQIKKCISIMIECIDKSKNT